MYVKVSVNIPRIAGVFDYHLPEELADGVLPGCLVVVPFGKQTVQGIVLERMQETSLLQTRPVLGQLDAQPVLNLRQLALAKWLADQTLAPLSACLELMIPPGLSKQADTLYEIKPGAAGADTDQLSPLQQRVFDKIRTKGALKGRQLAAAFPHQNWKPAAQALVRRGRLIARPVLPAPTARPKRIRNVQLACPPDIAEAKLPLSGKGAANQRRQDIIRHLLTNPWPVPLSQIYAATGAKLADLKVLSDQGLVIFNETEIWRDPLDALQHEPYLAPTLTAQQQAIWQQIQSIQQANAAGQSAKPILLNGVTGSGKTEIYLHAVQETLDSGRQAIVLVPEIALTPQTLRRFSGRFPGQAGIIHSRLSEGERYDTWRRARAGDLPVIIGPRSALFAPLPSLGLIVVDECHDDSYYHNDLPYYHAVQAAIQLAGLSNCVALLGSATPGVSLTYQAQHDNWTQLELSTRIRAHQKAPASSAITANDKLPLPPVEIVDMRAELKAGNRSIFSRPLQQALAEVLSAQQQAILFLNRRGSSTYVFCRECGHSLRCPRCDLPLTCHIHPGTTPVNAAASSSSPILRCHTCNYTRRMPLSCPQCGSKQIRQYGTGTEKVESEVQALFPQARTLRWDADTAGQKGAHEILLTHFVQRKADILIGTQMLAKGLDLPLVTLVGVVLADAGLNFPDYRAAERSFNLLMQVAGRAGRSALGGKAIFQTFQPDHIAIRMAAQHDFNGFYREELRQRYRLRYPPYFKLARLEVRSLIAKEAEQSASAMARLINQQIKKDGFALSDVIGPVPCFFAKVKGYYRWQVILRSPDPVALLKRITLDDVKVEVNPPDLL
ncbi:MAG: primosomal protein N' [Anaerolineaceae bacterium]|jgi:primosomal protein N' (replication factor Y)